MHESIVCPSGLLGELGMKIVMQIYIRIWGKREEAHNLPGEVPLVEEAVSAKRWNSPPLNEQVGSNRIKTSTCALPARERD